MYMSCCSLGRCIWYCSSTLGCCQLVIVVVTNFQLMAFITHSGTSYLISTRSWHYADISKLPSCVHTCTMIYLGVLCFVFVCLFVWFCLFVCLVGFVCLFVWFCLFGFVCLFVGVVVLFLFVNLSIRVCIWGRRPVLSTEKAALTEAGPNQRGQLLSIWLKNTLAMIWLDFYYSGSDFLGLQWTWHGSQGELGNK